MEDVIKDVIEGELEELRFVDAGVVAIPEAEALVILDAAGVGDAPNCCRVYDRDDV